MTEYSPSTGYSGFWKRFAAVIIDAFALAVPGFILGMIIGLSFASRFNDEMSASLGADLMGRLVGIGLAWLYYSLMESSAWQATLGKMALGIVVVDASGDRLTWGRASGRYFGKIISAIPMGIGFLLAGFTQKKQALHDMMAGTFVVNKRAQTQETHSGTTPPPFAGFQDIPKEPREDTADKKLLSDGGR